jgi:HlyD family secretion protein
MWEQGEMKKQRKLLSIGGLVLAGGLGAWALLRGQNGTEYRTAAVERGDIAYTISATGTPNAVVTVQVGSQVSGNVLALYADFNTRVTKGQVVARIDPQIFQARVDQASAALAVARAAAANSRAGVQKAQADVAAAVASTADTKSRIAGAQVTVQDSKVKLERRVQLANEGVLSREERDTAQATYDSALAQLDAANAQATASQENVTAARAQVEAARTQQAQAEAQVRQAEATLAQAQLDLEHTFIRAPVDGVVVARHVDVGQTVAASLQAPTLFEIAQDLTKMQVDTNVSEADVGRVQVGQPAEFTVDAYPNHVFRGLVKEIRKAPINVQNVITYNVVIAVDNPDLKLFPGMTANVKVMIDEHKDVLKIPNAALRFRPAGNDSRASGTDRRRSRPDQATVWVPGEGSKVEPVNITVGLTDGAVTEVTGGALKEGDRIVVAAFSKDEKRAPAAASPFGAAGGGGRRRGPGF